MNAAGHIDMELPPRTGKRPLGSVKPWLCELADAPVGSTLLFTGDTTKSASAQIYNLFGSVNAAGFTVTQTKQGALVTRI